MSAPLVINQDGNESTETAVNLQVNQLRTLDQHAQERAITAVLSRSRTDLLVVLALTAPGAASEFKARIATLAEAAKQLCLSKEIQLDITEIVRWAERAVGLAIRKGQSEGTVETKSQASSRGAAIRDGRAHTTDMPKPTDFAGKGELVARNDGRRAGIYEITDGISDEQFEEAITEAKAEGNLSRANVVRKTKAKASPAVPDNDPQPKRPTPKAAGGPKRNSTEMLENVNGMLQGIVQTLQYIDPADVDTDAAPALITQIRESLGLIRKTTKEIENV